MSSPSHQTSHSRKRIAYVTVFGAAINLASIVSVAVCLGLVQAYWAEEGLAFFTQVRRFSTILAPALILGQSFAIPRFLAQAHDSPERADRIAFSGSVTSIGLALLAGVCLLLFPRPVAITILGSESFFPVAGAFALLASAKSLAWIGGSHLRGKFRYTANHLLTFMFNGGISLLIILIMSGSTVVRAIWTIAVVQLIVAAILPVSICISSIHRYKSAILQGFARITSDLLVYGIARLPGQFLNVFLLGFGAWQLARAADLDDVGVFNSILTLAIATNFFGAMMCYVLLPMLSANLKSGHLAASRRIVETVLFGAMTLGVFLAGQLFLFGPSIVWLILRIPAEQAQSWTWGLPFLMIAGMLLSHVCQNALDAQSTFPFHLISAAAGALAMLATWYLALHWSLSSTDAVGLTYAVGYSVMGCIGAALTAWRFEIRLIDMRQLTGVVVALLITLLAWLSSHWLLHSYTSHIMVIGISTALFLAALWLLRIPWFLAVIGYRRPAGGL